MRALRGLLSNRRPTMTPHHRCSKFLSTITLTPERTAASSVQGASQARVEQASGRFLGCLQVRQPAILSNKFLLSVDAGVIFIDVGLEVRRLSARPGQSWLGACNTCSKGLRGTVTQAQAWAKARTLGSSQGKYGKSSD